GSRCYFCSRLFMPVSPNLKCGALIFSGLLTGGCLIASGQQAIFSDIHVDKKPGQQTGTAIVTIKGKAKQLTRHALEAWPVMDGQNALVIVSNINKDSPGEKRLRFYEGETRKFRDLGLVPFSSAELQQQKQSD